MKEQEPSFEEKLQTVQDIISRIEGGRLPLEESVRQFEDGMKTLSALEDDLKDMNRRLTVLRDGQEQELKDAGEEDEEL